MKKPEEIFNEIKNDFIKAEEFIRYKKPEKVSNKVRLICVCAKRYSPDESAGAYFNIIFTSYRLKIKEYPYNNIAKWIKEEIKRLNKVARSAFTKETPQMSLWLS